MNHLFGKDFTKAFLLIGGFAAVAALSLLQVQKKRQVVELGYQLTRASLEQVHLQDANRKLRVELSLLTHPNRIAKLAEKMGMRPVEPISNGLEDGIMSAAR